MSGPAEKETKPDKIEIAGHEVYPDQKSVLPCPVCEETQDVYYLGSRSSPTAGDEPRSYAVSAWVCPECGSVLEVMDDDMMDGTDHLSWADVIVRDESHEEEDA